jgi:hypothetical protein
MKRIASALGAAAALLALTAAAAASPPPIKVKVTAELANIRLKPSIGSAIIRQIPEGEILEATKKEGEWYLVKIDPDETGTAAGYVHESLVLPLEEVPPAKTRPRIIEKPIETPPVKPETKPAIPPAPVESAAAEMPEPSTAGRGRFFVSLFGGAGDALVGALNEGAQGLADLYSAQLGIPADRDVAGARLGLLYGGEVGIPLARGIFLTVGVERFFGAKESGIEFVRAGGVEPDTFTARPKFATMPVRAAIVTYPLEFVFVRIGAAYHFASCEYRYRFTHDDFWQEWTGEAKAGGFGVLGGLGLDWALAENVAVFAEISGHYAPISGFDGTGTFQDSTLAEPTIEEGLLYSYDARILGQTKYPLLYIRNKIPSEAGVENARQAKVDFSGVSLRLGFRLGF